MAFEDIASRLMAGLMADYGLTREQAAGFVGNLAHESGGFRTLQEIRPVVAGSRGGYGYAQWTGPRRKAFEAWAADRQLDPASYDANYGFLRHELDTTREGKVLASLRAAPDLPTATAVVEREFLRPGIPHTGSRMKWAQRALGGGAVPTQPTMMAQGATRARSITPGKQNAPAPAADAPSPMQKLLGVKGGKVGLLDSLFAAAEPPPVDTSATEEAIARRQAYAGKAPPLLDLLRSLG